MGLTVLDSASATQTLRTTTVSAELVLHKILSDSAGVLIGSISAANALRVAVVNASGAQLGLSGAPIRVDPTGSTTQPVSHTGLTDLAAAINASRMDVNVAASAVDLALGTDISNVFGTSSLVLATQADNLANTSDGLQSTAFGYYFDGTTWDRVRGDSTNGMLVNLGANNDVSVTGEVDVTPGSPVATSYLPVRISDGTGFLVNPSATEDDAAGAAPDGNAMLLVRKDTPASDVSTDGDFIAARADASGRMRVVQDQALPAGTNEIGVVNAAVRTDRVYDGTALVSIKSVNRVFTTSGANEVLAAVAGKRFRVLGFQVIGLASTNAWNFQDDAGTPNVLWATSANGLITDTTGATGPGGYDHAAPSGAFLFETPVVNQALDLNCGAAAIMVNVVYAEVD